MTLAAYLLTSSGQSPTKQAITLLQEAARRHLARTFLVDFATFTLDSYIPAAHHRLIGEHLERVERGELLRLAITMPPRHGKSELASIRFPAWYLGRNSDKRIILASYADSLASTFGRQIRDLIQDDRFRSLFSVAMSKVSSAADHWNIEGRRGGLIAAGVGSGITGHGADLLIIDDPIKDAAEADSPTVRENKWQWYTRTAYTRLQPRGAVVLIGTRWHDDDMIGRALAQDEENWVVLHLPALSSDGQALWPTRYPVEELIKIKNTVGLRAWESLYQGRPVPDSGGIFERGWFSVEQAAPVGGREVRFWDLAATRPKLTGDPDYTVGCKMRLYDDGRIYVLDVVRTQESPAGVDRAMMNVARQDGPYCPIRWEFEGGASGVRDNRNLVTMFAGYDAAGISPQGDKVLRAKPFAAQAKAGNVTLVEGPWVKRWLDELAAFPYVAHDDQVDAASGAYNFLVAGIKRRQARSFQA